MDDSLIHLLQIGPARRKQLDRAGVAAPEDLLARCRTPEDRRRFHDGTGLGPDQLLDWALTLDLLRLPDVDAELARLLRAAGVDGVSCLRHRRPAALANRLAMIAPEDGRADARLAARWIAAAQALPTTVVF